MWMVKSSVSETDEGREEAASCLWMKMHFRNVFNEWLQIIKTGN